MNLIATIVLIFCLLGCSSVDRNKEINEAHIELEEAMQIFEEEMKDAKKSLDSMRKRRKAFTGFKKFSIDSVRKVYADSSVTLEVEVLEYEE
jgi:hypothetical protein